MKTGPGLAIASALLLAICATPLAAVQGTPNHPYAPLADWSPAVSLIEADRESLGWYESDYAKPTAVIGLEEADRLLLRIDFEKPLDEYFRDLTPNRLRSQVGVWFVLLLDADASPSTGLREADRLRGADLEITVSGKQLQDRYDISGRYRSTEAGGASGTLDVSSGNLSYGGSSVELAVPRSALPAAGDGDRQVAIIGQVTVGDRQAASLRGTWPAAASAPGGGRAVVAAPSGAAPAPADQAQADSAFRALLAAVEREDEAAGRAAFGDLTEMGATAYPYLEGRLVEGSQMERLLALDIVRHTEGAAPAFSETIRGLADDPDEEVRVLVAGLLPSSGESSETVPALVALLDDDSPRVRAQAAESLGSQGRASTPAVPRLVSLLKDPEGSVASQSVAALGKIGAQPDLVVPALVDVLDAHRLAAMKALGEFGADARAAVPALVGVLEESVESGNDWHGHDAAVALGRIGGPQAAAALPLVEQVSGMMTADNWKQDVDDVLYKLRASSDAGQPPAPRELSFAESVETGDVAALRRLLADGADPNQSKDGSPALTQAIRGGHVDSALLLLASGADPNVRDVLQWTPIMWAVSLGSVELVEALIAAGADLQVRDTMNRSLVQMAGGSKRLKKLLVQAGAPQ